MVLTKELAQQRLVDTETRFNAAKVHRDQVQAQLEDAENECMRLQGEYRAATWFKDQAELNTPETAEDAVAPENADGE